MQRYAQLFLFQGGACKMVRDDFFTAKKYPVAWVIISEIVCNFCDKAANLLDFTGKYVWEIWR